MVDSRFVYKNKFACKLNKKKRIKIYIAELLLCACIKTKSRTIEQAWLYCKT